MKEIVVDGVTYVPKCCEPKGLRHICVLDKGWIFVGDRVVKGERIHLTNVKNIRCWESYGFGGLIQDPKKCKAVFDKCDYLSYHYTAEIFIHPVDEDWDD